MELTKKDSERGSEGDVPELPEASGAASGKLPAGAAAERPQPLSLNARVRSLPDRPASAELRRLPNRQPLDGPNRQQGAPNQAQAIEGRAQSLIESRAAQPLGTKVRGSIDSIDRFLDLELSLPPIASPRTAANTQPHA